MRRLALLAVVAVIATPAFAEKALVNIHLDPMAGFGIDHLKFVTGATLKVDTTAIKALGPVAPQLEGFGIGAHDTSYLQQGSLFGVGIGARLRILNDEKGYLFNPGTKRTGNAWGNLWLDSHFTYTSGGFGPGFDVGLGAELSMVEGLNVGPFAKFVFARQRPGDTTPTMLMMFGISFSVGVPQTTPEEADHDNDGVLGDNDKCIDEPEDKDGFEDDDGCPDKDNDKDGVEDAKDKCPNAAEDKDGIQDSDGCPEDDADKDGVLDVDDKCPKVKGTKENNGCADKDKDGDGVMDRLDKCPDDKGSADNEGCPDKDTDDDGTFDRLDACPNEKGPSFNKGCALPDADKDGTADEFDNCVSEPGPADNSGCPVAKKQLVMITVEKLVIKDKVYFDTGKATIQARSNALLDQVAAALQSHAGIKLVQVEGHTDNTGSAETNRTLSADRAKAVVAYLVKKGVAAERLKAVGFGPDQPAASNDTPAGREQNRRVEFNLTR